MYKGFSIFNKCVGSAKGFAMRHAFPVLKSDFSMIGAALKGAAGGFNKSAFSPAQGDLFRRMPGFRDIMRGIGTNVSSMSSGAYAGFMNAPISYSRNPNLLGMAGRFAGYGAAGTAGLYGATRLGMWGLGQGDR